MRARLIAVSIMCGGAAAAFWLSQAVAQADTHIVVGGNTDCTSQGLTDTLAAQGRLQGTPVPVSYGTCDGDFAPWLGSTPAGVAIQQGVDATRAAWDQHCSDGSRCVIEGFSLGDAPAAIVGTQVGADRPGSNTHVITNGNAWGDPGMFGPTPGPIGSAIKAGAPLFVGTPPVVPQVPGSENRNQVNDAWGANAGQPPWAEITQLSTVNGAGDVPPQHVVPAGEPVAEYTSPDGVHQQLFGEPLPGVVPPQDNPVVNPPLPEAPPVPGVPSLP